jgi:hypothetical protein
MATVKVLSVLVPSVEYVFTLNRDEAAYVAAALGVLNPGAINGGSDTVYGVLRNSFDDATSEKYWTASEGVKGYLRNKSRAGNL